MQLQGNQKARREYEQVADNKGSKASIAKIVRVCCIAGKESKARMSKRKGAKACVAKIVRVCCIAR